VAFRKHSDFPFLCVRGLWRSAASAVFLDFDGFLPSLVVGPFSRSSVPSLVFEGFYSALNLFLFSVWRWPQSLRGDIVSFSSFFTFLRLGWAFPVKLPYLRCPLSPFHLHFFMRTSVLRVCVYSSLNCSGPALNPFSRFSAFKICLFAPAGSGMLARFPRTHRPSAY